MFLLRIGSGLGAGGGFSLIRRDSLGYLVSGTKFSSLVARFLTILVVYLIDKAAGVDVLV